MPEANRTAAIHVRVLGEGNETPISTERLQSASTAIAVWLIVTRFHPMAEPLRTDALRTVDFIISEARWADGVPLNPLPTMLRYGSNAPGLVWMARAGACFSLPSFFLSRLNLLFPLFYSYGSSPGCAAGESTAASSGGMISPPAGRVFALRSAFPRLGANACAREANKCRDSEAGGTPATRGGPLLS